MRSQYTVQTRSARKVLALAAELGADAERLAAAVGVDPSDFDDPDARMPEDRLLDLYDLAAAATGDAWFGLHLGERADLRGFDVLGYAIMHSATVAEALDRTVRYYALWSEGTAFGMRAGARGARLTYAYRGVGRERRHECEATFAIVLSAVRALTGTPCRARRVGFQHEAPADVAEHERVFGVRPRFGAPANELELDRATLDLRVVNADASLCALLDRHASELLSRAPDPTSASDRVRATLGEALRAGDAGLEAVARRLGVGARTLQRRLQAEGTSHQELLDATRRELALRYVERPDLALGEVAFLLGYSEAAAFTRAFRRWTGLAPGAYRRRLDTPDGRGLESGVPFRGVAQPG